MVEPSAVSVGKLTSPELRTIVQDVTRIASHLLRPFGVNFVPATEEEAEAIAIPGARMIAKSAAASRVIRKVSDPIVLVASTVALFSVRRMMAQRDRPAAPPQPPRGTTTQTSAMPQAPMSSPPPPANRRASDAYESGLRDSILDSIAGAGLV